MILLVHHLLVGKVSQGRKLIYSAVAVWLTNIIVYGLWFWEVDRGGPHRRASGEKLSCDLQFPQMENPQLAPETGVLDSPTTSTRRSRTARASLPRTRCR